MLDRHPRKTRSWQIAHAAEGMACESPDLSGSQVARNIEDRKQAEERMRNENLALQEEIDRSSMFEESFDAPSHPDVCWRKSRK
jgi:hypothetical protein